MSKREVVSSALAEPTGHYSHAITIAAAGTLVFISGMTARTVDGGIAGIGDVAQQTHQTCRNLQAAVEQAGGSLQDIVRVDVFVADIRHFDVIHEVRRQYFTGVAPASTMVEVSKFVKPEYLIEINAIAVVT